MLDRDTNTNIPANDGPSGPDFWHSPTLEELAEAQGVTPIADVHVLFGTWPGEPDDGFEALIDELRHPEAAPLRPSSSPVSDLERANMHVGPYHNLNL